MTKIKFMETLKADLEARKAAVREARSNSRSFVIRKEIEDERRRKYHEEQSQQNKAKATRDESPVVHSMALGPPKGHTQNLDDGIDGQEEGRLLPHTTEAQTGPATTDTKDRSDVDFKQASRQKTREEQPSLDASENERFFNTLMAKYQPSTSALALKGCEMPSNEFLFLFFKYIVWLNNARLLLMEWSQEEVERTLVNKPAAENGSLDSKRPRVELQPIVRDKQFLAQIYAQTIEYLTPFFSLLREDRIPQDVLDHLVEIVEQLQIRNYVKANDAYIRLSIGNAPWPIGVTMVCIHERSARERIHSNQVAHVLNDERQRKWIQSIKRLISFCQRAHPPDVITHALG